MPDCKDGHEWREPIQSVLWDFLCERNERVRWLPASSFVRMWRYESSEAMRLKVLANQLRDTRQNVLVACEAMDYPVWLVFDLYNEGRLTYLDGRFHATSLAQYL